MHQVGPVVGHPCCSGELLSRTQSMSINRNESPNLELSFYRFLDSAQEQESQRNLAQDQFRVVKVS